MSNQGAALKGYMTGAIITLAYAYAAVLGHVLVTLAIIRFFTCKGDRHVI